MKITGIDIGEYRQFKNIKFDFTYPIGHKKEGQPLEKVCFIGQSGTGKTTLLNIIWDFFSIVNDGYHLQGARSLPPDSSSNSYQTFEHGIRVLVDTGQSIIHFDKSTIENNEKSSSDNLPLAYGTFKWAEKINLYEIIYADDKICLYIDDSAINHSYSLTINRNDVEAGNRSFTATKDEIFIQNEKQQEFIDRISKSKILNLNFIDRKFLWNYLLNDIDKYDENLKKIAIDLIQKSGSFSATRMNETLNKWQRENPNPRLDIAKHCLDFILNFFFLEVDTEGTEAPIVIKKSNGKQLTYNQLSTGTRQLLATAIPIYRTSIEKGVILFDEPERSLFPDIQRELVKYYTSLAPKAQFFFATHSPIIASAFEPCERFILCFDENGEVNYRNGVAPIGDDPNDILSADFGLNDLMLDEGLEAYQEYRRLGMLIRNETDDQKKNELIIKRLELGNRYNF